MALATLADVRRYLPGVTVDDNILQPLLDSVTEWIKEYANADWDASGSVTENFYHVMSGKILKLKDSAPSSVAVNTYLGISSTASALTIDSGFRVMSNGRVQLREISRMGRVQGLRPEELDAAGSGDTEYSRVEVTYTASNVVPAPIKEAVAMTVAARYSQAKLNVSGVKSERLGDYSYTREDSSKEGSVPGVPDAALTNIEPYRRTRRAVTV